MAKKFIKGTFELDKDVSDIVAYEEERKNKILKSLAGAVVKKLS